MADNKKVSEMQPANELQGEEYLYTEQTGYGRYTTPANVKQYIHRTSTTDDVVEGTDNLYFTESRADARVAVHGALTNNPHSVTKTQIGLANVLNTLHKFDATDDPDTDDDANDGYTVGSTWVNVTDDKFWMCVDATVSAAVWVEGTNASVTKSSLGLGNVENTALSTWAGTTNITTIAESAVTDHESAIDHDSLTNFDNNEHIDHTSVSISAGTGLSGGGDISADRTININIVGLSTSGVVDAATDQMMIYDNSEGEHRVITIDTLLAALDSGTVVTGMCSDFIGLTAPTGFVMLNGKTIGNGSSSATERANDDTELLFTLLWNSWADAQAPVSSGRGASAAADFAANKTITLPDCRSRVIIGQDDMGGTASNRITSSSTGGANSTTPGGTGGAQTHTMTSTEMPVHSHSITAAINAINQGYGGGNAIIASAAAYSTGNAGSGGAHSNTQPWIVMSKIIKL